MKDKFLIGEFSELTGISKRMLRHYDKLAVFRPTEISEENGYRWYSIDQIDDLDRIQFLQKLGFSLSDINELLAHPIALVDFLKDLKHKEMELNKTSDEIKSSLLMTKRLIHLIENQSIQALPSIHKLLDWERGMAMTVSKENLVDLSVLMNRELFLERVEDRVNNSDDKYHYITFDIDHFMHVNDIDGYDVGDAVIQNIISIVYNNMQPFLDEEKLIAREGGDECSVMLVNQNHESVMKAVTNSLVAIRTFNYNSIGCSRTVTSSIGVCHGGKPEHYLFLKDEAHKALLDAKRNGRDQIVVKTY